MNQGAPAVNPLVRWGKFNLVGAGGMVVQLSALGVIQRCTPGHYLLASAAAVELAVLHNFAWHVRYTWRDRRDPSHVLNRMVRFHLSNGMVSILGNVVFMQLFVKNAGMAVLPANGVAILCCSIVIFSLGTDGSLRGMRRFHHERVCLRFS